MDEPETEASTLVAKGSDGRIHDLHRIETPVLTKAGEPGAESAIEWIRSDGAVVETSDGTTFHVVDGADDADVMMTKIAEIEPSGNASA